MLTQSIIDNVCVEPTIGIHVMDNGIFASHVSDSFRIDCKIYKSINCVYMFPNKGHFCNSPWLTIVDRFDYSKIVDNRVMFSKTWEHPFLHTMLNLLWKHYLETGL